MVGLLKIMRVLPVILLFYTHSYSQCKLGEYISIKDHPKSKGVNMKIRVPIGWEVNEGNRPNIVKRFVFNNDVISLSYGILVTNLPTFFSRNEIIEEIKSEEDLRDWVKTLGGGFNIGGGFNFILGSSKLVLVDGYPSIYYKIRFKEVQELGVTFIRKMEGFAIFYEDKIIIVYISLKGYCKNCNKKFPTYENFLERCFLNISNSIVFPEQYQLPSYE